MKRQIIIPKVEGIRIVSTIIVMLSLYLCTPVIGQHKYNIRLSKQNKIDTATTLCFDIQLNSADSENWELAGQNYRMYYDASKAKFTEGASLLGTDYQAFNLSQHIHDVNASATAGGLQFEAHLGFLNFAIDLLDPSRPGKMLSNDGSWVNTAQICFDLLMEEGGMACPDFDIVWARPEKTNVYATSFVEISARTGINQTEMTQGVAYLDNSANCATSGIIVNAKAFLQGAISSESDEWMQDKLRDKGYLPLTEPYSQLKSHDGTSLFQHLNAGETTTKEVLQISGKDAIVDWVLLELRNAQNPTEIIATRAALIQRSGDIVDIDGNSEVNFEVPEGAYFLSLKHRNHLGIMTQEAIYLDNKSELIDFSNPLTPLYGSHAARLVGSRQILWGGNADGNRYLVYQGGGIGNPDSDFIFFNVVTHESNLLMALNYVLNGYHSSDLNMDGNVLYQGANNEVGDILFYNILSHPINTNFFTNFFITEQIPYRN